MSSNPTDQTIDTPSKLRPPRTFVAPATQPNTNISVNEGGASSTSQISPGGRTLRKRRLDSSDESLSIKPSQTSKKVILQSNPSANTIKSNSSIRTTSSLANSRNNIRSSSLASANATSAAANKKLNYSARPGWDTKVIFLSKICIGAS